ncbi:MAG: cell volume regulation protein A [Zhongshania aliphaticivorans]|jgi:cell volume regulation protein A|uniref:potassium/proton antiporter n=1 Tax=Zhongshania aliphaticivorans TaxID=1470434 RepID=UPI00025C17EB|nr:potassium/proton antiporter [Zhongshania aliphaticivorans]EIF43787.1 NhaP-type Na+/H+ and K+/H+ antiporter [gamma proteobacterium BDW918]|tara:strand:+ start:62127 stop:63857 length:1731 start_codon:yes stop_codon:yes gene_type:complete
MIEHTYQLVFIGAALFLFAVFASIISRRLGAPLLLIFLLLGMLAGEDGIGGIHFDDIDTAFLIGNLALAIIIFDGGLGTRMDTFRSSLRPALSLATVGVFLTAGITGAAACYILDLPWQEGLLIGAIVGSTDAAAVFGLIKNAGLNLKDRTGATLEIESGSNDPMAIFLTITLVEALSSPAGLSGWLLLAELAKQMGLGLLFGVLGGYAIPAALGKITLPVSLYPLMVFAAALTLFGGTSFSGGSGFLAIYIAGVMTGTTSSLYMIDIRRFHDGIAWLSQIGMFLMLGLLVTPSLLPPIIIPALIIAGILIFIARPLAVAVSLLPFRFPVRDQVFVSWCGLRGAVPIILALFPSLAGLENARIYFELVFFVVLTSLVIQGWTIAPMARWLKVDLPVTLKLPSFKSTHLPSNPHKDLVVYQVVAGSSVIGKSIYQLVLPVSAQVVALIRDEIPLNSNEENTLQESDQVVIVATTGMAEKLADLFSPALSRMSSKQSSSYFGDFTIRPNSKLGDLALLYTFDIPDELKHLTVGEHIKRKFRGRPVVGDALTFPQLKLTVKEMKNGEISLIGLKLNLDS